MRAHFIEVPVVAPIGLWSPAERRYALVERQRRNAANRKRRPAVVIHFGASSQSIVWEGETYNFTNGDDKTLTLLANNVCNLCRIQ